MFLILIAIQACLLVYADQTPVNTNIWDFVSNMSRWSTIDFVLALFGIAAGIGLIGVAAGTVFGFKTDFLIFAPAVAGFITMGVVFTNLARVMTDELIGRIFTTCDVNQLSACMPVVLIIAVTIGPVAFYYVWTVIEWWRGKDY